MNEDYDYGLIIFLLMFSGSLYKNGYDVFEEWIWCFGIFQ